MARTPKHLALLESKFEKALGIGTKILILLLVELFVKVILLDLHLYLLRSFPIEWECSCQKRKNNDCGTPNIDFGVVLARI